MNSIERLYYDRLKSMSCTAKFARVCDLYEFARTMIKSQIANAHPHITEQEMKVRIAERMYSSDKQTMTLIQKWKQQLGIRT